MTRIKIRKLEWDYWNAQHIKKHNLSIAEVEKAARNMQAHKRAYHGRYLAIGRTGSRIVSIVINRISTGVYYVITARDSNKKERRLIYDKEKK